MNFLITGCAGFIGSHVTEKLLNNGHVVVGIDNFNDFYDPDIKFSNIKSIITKKCFKLYNTDILHCNIKSVLYENKVDCVIHLAASAGVLPSFSAPMDYNTNNVQSTIHLLESMREANLKNLVCASSSSVYGNNQYPPFSEKHTPKPISMYGINKLSLEHHCRVYSNAYDFSSVCLRFFTCYGPRQRPDLAIHKFSRLMSNNEIIDVYGDGKTGRDYTYIDDIIDGIIKTIQLVCNNKKMFEAINLGNSKPITLGNMIQEISKRLCTDPKLNYVNIPTGDALYTHANITKAKQLLNWEPKVTFSAGMDKFINWFLRKRI